MMDDLCSQFLADNDIKKFVVSMDKYINHGVYKGVTGDLEIRCQWVIKTAETSNLRVVRQQATLIYNECVAKDKLFLKKVTEEELKDVDNGWSFGKHYE